MAVAAFVALILLLREGEGFSLRPGTLPLHLLRSLCGTVGVLCNFYAVDHLVLSNASILNKMSPFFVLIFSWLFLKERLTPFQTAAFFMAFVGALFVVQPVLSNLALGPSLIGLCSGMGAGAAYTAVRALGLRGERSPVIVFFFSTFSCVVLLPWLFFHFQPMTLHQLLMLLGAGVAAAGGGYAVHRPAGAHGSAAARHFYDRRCGVGRPGFTSEHLRKKRRDPAAMGARPGFFARQPGG